MRNQPPVRAQWLDTLVLPFLVFLAACAAPTPPAPTGSVDGIVTEGSLFGVAGVVVRAQGRTTITDGEGRFTLEGIAVPYDLSLSQTSGDGWLHVIEGLTDRAPVVDPFGASSFGTPPPAVDVTGALTGGGAWPLPAGREVIVCVEGLGVLVVGCDMVSTGSSYALTASFLFATEGAVRLHALRIVRDADGRPTGYEGYGVADAMLEAGVPIAIPLNLGVVPAVDDLEVAFDLPGGSSLGLVLVSLRLGNQGSLPLYQSATGGSTLTMPVPTLPGARYAVFASAAAGGGSSTSWSVAEGLDVGPIAFGVPSQLVQPAGGAVDVAVGTAFEAIVPGSGPRTFRWTTGAGPDFSLTTTRASVTLPDPVAAGFAWPAGTAYDWSVRTHDAATVDDAAASLDSSALSLAIFFGFDLPASGGLTESATRAVTFGP